MSAAPTLQETHRYAVTRPRASIGGDWHVRQRWMVLALAAVGAVVFCASWFFPYWNFLLIAPQYPSGLFLVIALTGVTGDTAEINTINHYIGMAHIEAGAELERAAGGYIVAALALVVMTAVLFAGKRLNWVALVLAAALPLGFIGDTMYWLYTFGHDLDPSAAIEIAPFTPTLFGAGKVGQFATHAWPAIGFWMAVVGASLVTIASGLRQRVCAACPDRGHCEGLCRHGLVSPPKTRAE